MTFNGCNLFEQIYRPPSGNVALFDKEMFKIVRQSNTENNAVLVGDVNIEVSNTSKMDISDYLNIFFSYTLENIITDYTREEYSNGKLTKTCINHILIRTNVMRIGSGVIRHKLADHYFVAMMAFGEDPIDFRQNGVEYGFFIDNRTVNDLMKQYDWNCLLKHDHLALYDKLVNKMQETYNKSQRKFRLQLRSTEKGWINKDIMELCNEKDILWK